jgi:hypothetical protein
MDNQDWNDLRKSVSDIHEAIVGSTNKVGLIEWQRAQDVKLADLGARLTRLESAKDSVIATILRQLWLAAWASFIGALAYKIGGGN